MICVAGARSVGSRYRSVGRGRNCGSGVRAAEPSKAGRVPAMFGQGGVDERQQLFVRGRELLNERRRRASMGADDDEDYNGVQNAASCTRVASVKT